MRRKPLQPCGTTAAYQRHRKGGEEPCALCREASRLDGRKRREKWLTPWKIPPCGTKTAYQRHLRKGEEPCEPCREASREYHRNLYEYPYWVVYVRKFVDGMWYYGSTKLKLEKRETDTKGKIGDYLQRGVKHTAEILMRCDSKELALQMEARFILASDRSKLLNEEMPWHFCWETNPGVGAYAWHRRRGEEPCEPSREAKRTQQRRYYAKRKAKRELEAGQ